MIETLSIAPSQLRPLQNLRYLYLDKAQLEGDFKNTLQDLKWLYCFSVKIEATNLVLKDLVVLNLRFCDLKGWLSKIEVRDFAAFPIVLVDNFLINYVFNSSTEIDT